MGLNLFLDNISIDFAPDCIPVSGLNYSEISTSSVKLDWIENGNSTQWEIVYGESGFDVEGSDSQSIFANDNPEFILSDLESNTTYDIYIRSVCDEDGSSAFSEPVTITTFCDAASVPFIQDFEDVTTPNIPACSTVEVIDGGNWRSNTATGIGFSGKVLQYQSDYGNDPANSWFFLQGIELEAGINYTISFGYANGTMDFTEKLKVMYGTYPKEADMTEELVDLPSIQTTTVLTEEVPFTVEEDGVYYFGFNVYSNPYNANLNIDDIIIEQDEEDIFYCESEYYSSCEFGNQISNVSLQGESVNLDNDSQCSNGGNGDYTQLDNPDLLPGGTYEVSVSSDYFFLLGQNIRIWIDYDNDGVFDDSEEIGNTNGSGMHNSGTNSFTFTIPADIQEGLHRMRVRLVSHDGYIDPCGEEFSGETEDYNVSILPAPSCLPPSNLEISSIENSSAQLSWTPHSDETQWDVVYGVSGFVQNNGDSETLTVNTQPEVTIDGLNPGTMYDVYVKTICSENDESSASPILSFITQCEAANLPFFQDFEDVDIPNVPVCGSIETIIGNDWITAFDYHTASYNQQIVYSSDFISDAIAWYFIVEIALEADNPYQVSYDYGNVNSSFIEKLKVSMGESNSADDMTVELADHPNIYLGGKVNNVVYFSVENDGTYYFGFNAYSSPMGLNLFLDNISIDFAPDCIPVSGLNYSEISTSSVKLDWIENGNSTQWEIVYGESGFDVEGSDSQSIFANDNPEFILSDLESNTTYDIYIRSVCDEDGSSAFSEPVTITTFCDAASVPFIQDFEDVTTPNIPACSTVEVIDGGNWRSNTATGIGFSGKVLQYQSDYGNDPANSWFFLQGIELEAGINYTISFGYAN